MSTARLIAAIYVDRILKGAKLAERESYLGGSGIGGFDFISMDTLVRRFAGTTAEKTVEAVAPKKTADAR